MNDRDMTPDQAHDFALAIKWREDCAAATRALKRELWSIRWPALRFAGMVLMIVGTAFVAAGYWLGLADIASGGVVWYVARRRINEEGS